jgi:predicted RNA-binding protein with PIN domain
LPDPTLYLFDGSNLFHAGAFADRETLIDLLASYVAGQGAQGVVVFDGAGVDREIGPLAIRYAPDADAVLERLALERRDTEAIQLVTSDNTIRMTSGQEVGKRGSEPFLAELTSPAHHEGASSRVADRLDEETRARLERLRRGGG